MFRSNTVNQKSAGQVLDYGLELDLKTEQAYFQQLFEGTPEAIALVDNDDRILRANGEFLNLFGYGLDELTGRSLNELLAPPDPLAEARVLPQQVRSVLDKA